MDNYENLKQKFRNSDWENIDNYAENITDYIMEITSECVPKIYIHLHFLAFAFS